MSQDDDFWGFNEYFADKANPFAVGNWVSLVSKVEGRDKLFKMVQFTSRAFKWLSAESGDAKQEAFWIALYKSIQEGRKSVRLLKGINKVFKICNYLPTKQLWLCSFFCLSKPGRSNVYRFAKRSNCL